MTYDTTTLSPENLDNLSEEQMMAFATQFNAIEPGGFNVENNDNLLANFAEMLFMVNFVSIGCIVALAMYFGLPYLRQMPKKLSLIRS